MVGRSIVTNLPAMLALLVVAVVLPWRLFTRRPLGVSPVARLDIPVLAALAILWFVGGGLLTMLTIAPSTRYIETASVLVAPLFVYWAALLVTNRTKKITASP